MNEYQNLKWKYKLILMGVFLIGFILALPVFWYFNLELIQHYGITEGPVIGQENGDFWFWSMAVLFSSTCLIIGPLISLFIVGAFKGWGIKKVLNIYICKGYPRHWLN